MDFLRSCASWHVQPDTSGAAQGRAFNGACGLKIISTARTAWIFFVSFLLKVQADKAPAGVKAPAGASFQKEN